MSRAASHDVLVMGDVNLDVLVRPDRPIEYGTDVAAEIRQRPGGAGANVALGLTRLGMSTTLVGCVGQDDAGAVIGPLRAAGVQVSLRAVNQARTGAIVAIVGPDGERSMASDRGANRALCATDVTDELIAAHRHLHVSGYSMFDPATGPVVRAVIARAKALGRTVSVDPGSVAPLRAYGETRFLADVASVDLLLPNKDEAMALSGSTGVVAGARALAQTFPVVVVTRGAAGALWADRSGVCERPAPALPGPVLDTTGAGDAFTAGLLAAWLTGESPLDCLDAGQRAAAETVTRWGAQ